MPAGRRQNKSPACLRPLAIWWLRTAAAAVVIVDENRASADLINKAVFQRAIFRAVEKNRAAAINRPVRTHQRLLRVHHRARRLAESQPAQRNKFHRLRFVTVKLDQAAQPRCFHRCSFQIKPSGRIKIERVRFVVKKPFAGRIQFLENIFHETDLPMHRAAAIVLPTALHCHALLSVSLPVMRQVKSPQSDGCMA